MTTPHGQFVTIKNGDCRTVLKDLASESVQCVVTSPPYWGLRDYGHADQIGREATPQEYIDAMVQVFSEVRRVIRTDGTLWLNIGDSYCSTAPGTRGDAIRKRGILAGVSDRRAEASRRDRPETPGGMKPKDLVGIPWMLAFALRGSGWYLRQDIIWSKPNPMPESVSDRCTKSHEYIFLLTKSPRYFYNAAAIAEPLAYGSVARLDQDVESQIGSDRVPGKTNGNMKAVSRASWKGSSFDHGKTGEMKATHGKGYSKPYRNESTKDYDSGGAQDASATKARIVDRILSGELVTRNKRSVWTVTTKPYSEAHFATFPPDLILPCILAGTRPGDVVLDPFGGSGTTGMVAYENGRSAIMIELNEDYAKLCDERCATTPGLPLGSP